MWECVMAGSDNPQEYRRCAEECVDIANSLSNPAQRVTLLEMARAWLALADRAASRPSAGIYQAPTVELPQAD